MNFTCLWRKRVTASKWHLLSWDLMQQWLLLLLCSFWDKLAKWEILKKKKKGFVNCSLSSPVHPQCMSETCLWLRHGQAAEWPEHVGWSCRKAQREQRLGPAWEKKKKKVRNRENHWKSILNLVESNIWQCLKRKS